MARRVDLSGQKFGRLTAISDSGERQNRYIVWLCRCECGNETLVSNTALRSGHTQSCGCLQRDTASRLSRGNHHALTHGRTFTKEYRAWANMLYRCDNPNSQQYEYYGGRGISVCDEWYSFETFLADMGEAPSGTSLDRINNDGNYMPSNCRWAAAKQQANNRRPPRKRLNVA